MTTCRCINVEGLHTDFTLHQSLLLLWCRLGQTRPTRVIRLVASDTLEQQVLAYQAHKKQMGDSAPAGEDWDGGVMTNWFDFRPLGSTK